MAGNRSVASLRAVKCQIQDVTPAVRSATTHSFLAAVVAENATGAANGETALATRRRVSGRLRAATQWGNWKRRTVSKMETLAPWSR